MDALVGLRKIEGTGGRWETTAGEPAPATSLWAMLYTDDAGVVSKSPEQLRKMMDVIATVCAAFRLTVSDAKTEIMCLRTRGMSDAAATFSVEAADQVYKQTHEFVYFGGTSTTTPTCRSRSTGAYATRGATSGSIPSNCTTCLLYTSDAADD